ncbi:hypothetical protein BJX64DRAFT_291514 [Aspergillus heterothallicus]
MGEPDVPLTQGLRMTLEDKKLYIMAAISMCMSATIGVSNFFPTLAATLGYNHMISLLLVAPPYMFALVSSYIRSYLSDRTGHRFWFIWLHCIPGAVQNRIVRLKRMAEKGGPADSTGAVSSSGENTTTTNAGDSNETPTTPQKRKVGRPKGAKGSAAKKVKGEVKVKSEGKVKVEEDDSAEEGQGEGDEMQTEDVA